MIKKWMNHQISIVRLEASHCHRKKKRVEDRSLERIVIRPRILKIDTVPVQRRVRKNPLLVTRGAAAVGSIPSQSIDIEIHGSDLATEVLKEIEGDIGIEETDSCSTLLCLMLFLSYFHDDLRASL